MKTKIITLLLPALFLVGCTTNVTINNGNDSFTKNQVATHNKSTDCWTIINGKVYNITAYINLHPGGPDRISNACGIDGTILFDTGGEDGSHSSTAKATLDTYLIGTLTQ